eukprot:2656418-Amphidinium_carterae.2
MTGKAIQSARLSAYHPLLCLSILELRLERHRALFYCAITHNVILSVLVAMVEVASANFKPVQQDVRKSCCSHRLQAR